jgi:hypothetical protein
VGRGSICILDSGFWILDSKLPWASLGRDGRSVFCILYSGFWILSSLANFRCVPARRLEYRTQNTRTLIIQAQATGCVREVVLGVAARAHLRLKRRTCLTKPLAESNGAVV